MKFKGDCAIHICDANAQLLSHRRYYPQTSTTSYQDISNATSKLLKFQEMYLKEEARELATLKHRIPGFEASTAEQKEQKRAEVINKIMQDRLKDWMSLISEVPPSFRHYFTELNDVPSSWFAMRLNYVRSVATTSIVGHMVGLGDRHTSNILMDKKTGEFIHIDLGIAFDQVWCLLNGELE